MKLKMIKHKLIILSLVIFTILLLASFIIYRVGFRHAFAGSSKKSHSAIPIKVVYAKKTSAAKSIFSIGRVISNGRQVFTSPFTGRLIESFSFPKFVTAGTVIARVVSPGLYSKIISARNEVKYAKIKLKREKLLFRYGVAAKKDVETAALNLSGAYYSLRSLESISSEGLIVSRSQGTVRYTLANGAIVAAGSPVAVLNGKGLPWIKTYVTPSQSFYLYKNMTVKIKKRQTYETGKIISIGGSAFHNGLVPVYVSLQNNSILLPGEWVKVRFEKSYAAAFSLPKRAVFMYKGKTAVFTVVNNKAQAALVKVISQKDGYVYVKGQIKPEEPVIIYPVTRLKSGISVEIKH
jgi:hypothetical protein